MARDVATGDLDAFARSIQWALDRMAWLVIPVSAVLVAVALPMMRLVAFGSATKTGPVLLAAGIASLALGLYPYGAFLLLARSYRSESARAERCLDLRPLPVREDVADGEERTVRGARAGPPRKQQRRGSDARDQHGTDRDEDPGPRVAHELTID
jgi:hypothetical protein